MAVIKPTGQGASVRKYDILSAIATRGLAMGPHDQRLALRFMVLITARYNWAANRLSVGQREIARMWSVDERTVKRDMARLRDMGWLRLIRQGVRGRVSEYGIETDTILAVTEPYWEAIGPDFRDRQQSQTASPGQGAVIPFPGASAAPSSTPVPRCPTHPAWERVMATVRREDVGLCTAWLDPLTPTEAEGRLILMAPSRFHANYVRTHMADRLAAQLRRIDPALGGPDIACPRGDG